MEKLNKQESQLYLKLLDEHVEIKSNASNKLVEDAKGNAYVLNVISMINAYGGH